jgi:hypothetical protein
MAVLVVVIAWLLQLAWLLLRGCWDHYGSHHLVVAINVIFPLPLITRSQWVGYTEETKP